MSIKVRQKLLDIIDKSGNYADVDVSVNECIELYCQDNNISNKIMSLAQDLAFRQGAIAAGISISVIEGKTKLSDHFSKQFILYQCNKGVSK